MPSIDGPALARFLRQIREADRIDELVALARAVEAAFPHDEATARIAGMARAKASRLARHN